MGNAICQYDKKCTEYVSVEQCDQKYPLNSTRCKPYQSLDNCKTAFEECRQPTLDTCRGITRLNARNVERLFKISNINAHLKLVSYLSTIKTMRNNIIR